MKQCEEIDNVDYVSDCSCQQFFKEDAEFMKCIKNSKYSEIEPLTRELFYFLFILPEIKIFSILDSMYL